MPTIIERIKINFLLKKDFIEDVCIYPKASFKKENIADDYSVGETLFYRNDKGFHKGFIARANKGERYVFKQNDNKATVWADPCRLYRKKEVFNILCQR